MAEGGESTGPKTALFMPAAYAIAGQAALGEAVPYPLMDVYGGFCYLPPLMHNSALLRPEAVRRRSGVRSFLLITDVFCPWCYGFAPVMRRLLSEYGYPVRVLCGNLVDEPMLSSVMGDPKGLAFFKRLVETTGRPVGEGLYRLLEKGNGVLMDSSKAAVLLRALKKLAPGAALEQMEAFQEAFYSDGLDVLSAEVQAKVAARWGVDGGGLAEMLSSGAVAGDARKDMDEAEEILGDFVVYPTLYVRDDAGGLHAVARGYAPYEAVAEKLKAALESGTEAGVSAEACGPGGCCV